MSTNVTFNGTSYTVPALADASWGTNVSNYLIAIATGCLQKTGGTFTLTAEIDFGATYGLKSAYLKTKTVNTAAAGFARLAKTDTLSWRNNANSADLALAVDSSDRLTFNGTVLENIAFGTANQMLGMNSGATANEWKTLTAGATAGVTIAHGTGTVTLDTTQDIRTSASPTFTGLNLTSFSGVLKASAGAISAATIVNADVSNSAAIAYSKLALSGSIATGDLASGLLLPASKGGTGVANNAASTVTISGSYATTLTLTNTTALTLPTTGTLATLAGTENLTNKTLDNTNAITLKDGNNFILQNASDTTKQVNFTVGSATSTFINIITPNLSGTLCLTTGAQTLSNKTLASPIISSYSNSGTMTLPIGTDTVVARTSTDTLTNKTLTSPVITGESSTAITTLALRDTSAAFDVTIAATSATALTAGRTLTLDMANTSKTLKVVALSNFSTLTDGTANQVLATQGSGAGYTWASALTNVLTTTGDMVYSNSGATPARLAIGTEGQVLRATSGIPAWKFPSTTVTKSSTDYTITDTDGFMTVLVSTGASNRAITLPSIANNQDRTITIKKTDSGAGTVTITSPTANKLDGATSTYLTSQYASMAVTSDGTNWNIASTSGDYRSTPTGSGNSGTLSNASVYSDIVDLSLPAGTWDVRAMGNISFNTVVGLTTVIIGLSTSSGDANTVNSAFNRWAPLSSTAPADGNYYYATGTARFTFTTATTVHMKARAAATSGTISFGTDSTMEATRIR